MVGVGAEERLPGQSRATPAWHAAAASRPTAVQLSSEQRRRARPAHRGPHTRQRGGLDTGSGTYSSSISHLLNINIPAFSFS